MIVDLVRNDLGRVCRPGSIEVPELARAAGAHRRLASRLARHRRRCATASATPTSSAPRFRRARSPVRRRSPPIEVIHELESVARQVYTGAIGFASPVAGLELSVAIRTFEFAGGNAALQVGGGIVMDSIRRGRGARMPGQGRAPASGDRRACARAAHRRGPRAGAPCAAPGPATRPTRRAARDDCDPARRAAAPGGPPRPAGRGAGELYRHRTAGRARDPAREPRPAAQSAARLRIVLLPGGEVTLEVAAPPRAGDLTLASVVVPGGLGAHKWADRRLLDALAAAVAPAIPLLTDVDGFVLEAAMANVFALLGETLVTPPCDGRILPGTMRAQVLGAAESLAPCDVERPLSQAELARRERRPPHQRPARRRDGPRTRRRTASPAAREPAASRRRRRARAPARCSRRPEPPLSPRVRRGPRSGGWPSRPRRRSPRP